LYTKQQEHLNFAIISLIHFFHSTSVQPMVFLAHYSDLQNNEKKCWEFVAVPIRGGGETIKRCSFHLVPQFG